MRGVRWGCAAKSAHEERSFDSLNIFLYALTRRGSLRDDTVKKKSAKEKRRGFFRGISVNARQ
jgi:hypothetical protein